MPTKELELLLAGHCAPVLMGEKAANLVSLSRSVFPDPQTVMQYCSRVLGQSGICAEILCRCERRALLFLYRPDRLHACLAHPTARQILHETGYPRFGKLSEQIDFLRSRFEQVACPHEIGLFLGYPPQDVLAFIRTGGAGCKLCGYWKVYGDVPRAKRIFTRYDACRAHLCRRLACGQSLHEALQSA